MENENLVFLFRATFSHNDNRQNRILTENKEPIRTETDEYIEAETEKDYSNPFGV